MKRILILLFFLTVGCSTKQKDFSNKKDFTMYKQSEMSALMLKMYEKNKENKKMILEGKMPKNFPEEFLKIHTAKLTDSGDRTESFNAFSNLYLNTLKEVFNAPKEDLILRHNNVVNTCISCHQTTCLGPIPKIKKLLIK